MDRVGILVHPSRPVLDAVEVVASWAAEHDLELVQIPTAEQPPVAPPGEVSACDLIVAVGGDGTALKALHVSARTGTPVLGVEYGSLGVLPSVSTDELRVGLDRFAAGDWRPRDLPALVIRAGDARVAAAVNDAVVARGRGTQLLLDVRVDGELYGRLAGDGVILATPMGSSAYSMAAGGSLLPEGTDAFLCTPVAVHGGCVPPLVVAGGGEVTLDIHPRHSGFYLDVDGFPVDTVARQLEVTREQSYATLVAFDHFHTGFPRLRARGLIIDSPRVTRGERHATTEIEVTT